MPQHPQTLIINLFITTFSSSENVPALNGDVPVLNLLLKFITTNLQVPPTGLERKIAIRFQQFARCTVMFQYYIATSEIRQNRGIQ